MAASRHHAFDAALCVLLSLAAGSCGGKAIKPQVPDGARLVKQQAESRGMVPYMASEPGIAYIVDSNTGKVIFSVQMEVSDQLVVHPLKNMIFFNGTAVRQGGLDPKRNYQLYFLKS